MISDEIKPKETIQDSNYNTIGSPVVENKLKQPGDKIAGWMARNGLLLLRTSVGIVYFWFGIVKFFPGLSPAETLAANTISELTFGYIPSKVSLPFLAMWECTLGVGLIASRGMRVILTLLFLQMLGTF